jgi:cell division protein FtsL
VALFVGAFGAVFFLNNQMVATAWEIQQTQKALNVASAREATLEDQVVYASTPEGLLEKAEELGLTPATTVLHVDLKTGKIISPEQTGD